MAALNGERDHREETREKQYNELVDFSHYTCVNGMRCVAEDADYAATAKEEELFSIAHFLLKEAAWCPYKESLLAMCLIEKTGADAEPMWGKLLTPLEKAYDKSSGRGFENRFGHPYRPAPAEGESEEPAAVTRPHAHAILRSMATLAKEAGFGNTTAAQEAELGILTPREREEKKAVNDVIYNITPHKPIFITFWLN